MARFNVPERVLRDLVARYPFYVIGRMYNCDSRSVGLLAAQYGLSSAFTAKAGTAEEIARIKALFAEGWSIKRIAETMGRSQEFVARRARGEMPETGERKVRWRASRDGWPEPDITPAKAMRGRRYDDVSEEILVRECSPYRLPLNGAALTSAVRAAERSYSRSAAALCTDTPAEY